MPAIDLTNRRRDARLEIDQPVHVQSAGFWITVYARDVSASGFAFDSPVAFVSGEEIAVAFPEAGIESAQAVVRHVKREGGYWLVGCELDARLDWHAARAIARR